MRIGKYNAGLFCGAKVYSWNSWKVEGFKLRMGRVNYLRNHKGRGEVGGRETNFLLGLGPFIFWKTCSHLRLRCVHGAELAHSERRRRHQPGSEVARVACIDCNELIYGVKRPFVCTDSGYTHPLSRM